MSAYIGVILVPASAIKDVFNCCVNGNVFGGYRVTMTVVSNEIWGCWVAVIAVTFTDFFFIESRRYVADVINRWGSVVDTWLTVVDSACDVGVAEVGMDTVAIVAVAVLCTWSGTFFTSATLSSTMLLMPLWRRWLVLLARKCAEGSKLELKWR